nr:hypothetical protein [uncultured Albidiferax sp.]
MTPFSKWMLRGITLAFLVAVGCTIEWNDQHKYPWLATLAMVAVALLLAWWFLDSFVLTPLPIVGEEREMALTSIYAFTYTFTFLAVAFLAFPFGNLLDKGSFPEAGPIRLLNGCIAIPVPESAASASRPVWPKGMPICTTDKTESHTILVSIGGVIGSTDKPDSPSRTVYTVTDGFVVPLLVLVLALVGAIVNLMRFVPQFQKRTHINFVGTTEDKPLQPYEAREFVTFQILQLITAPFIAMVAFYAIAPQTLPAAIALAFVSGYLSQSVLLRISALVEGPGKTPTEATSQKLGEVEVHATDTTAGGVDMPGVRVTITQLSNNQKIYESISDAKGLLVVKALPLGKMRIEGTLGTRVATPFEIDIQPGKPQKAPLLF